MQDLSKTEQHLQQGQKDMATFFTPKTTDARVELQGRIETLQSQIKESLRQAEESELTAKDHRLTASKLAELCASYEKLLKP